MYHPGWKSSKEQQLPYNAYLVSISEVVPIEVVDRHKEADQFAAISGFIKSASVMVDAMRLPIKAIEVSCS